ncbi:hypothetical protein MTO96_023369 [Rhipicephalus appendiculatus]
MSDSGLSNVRTGRFGEVHVARCRSIDESVQELPCGKEMDGLKDVFLGHGEHAERGAISNTEKFDVWECLRRMECAEEAEQASAKEAETSNQVDATCTLRTRSLSLDSFLGDLELSAIGMATPPPLLYSRRPPFKRNAKVTADTATIEVTAGLSRQNASQRLDESTCEPGNLFTLSEPCSVGSSLGCDVSTYSKEESQRFLDKVLELRHGNALKDGISDFQSFFTGAISTSSPRPQIRGSGSTNTSELQRLPGLLPTEHSGHMAAKRHHHAT